MDIQLLPMALACAGLGAYSDLRTRRIPNWLTYGGMLLGLAAQTAVGGGRGMLHGLAGAGLGGGVFLVFFLLGGMGAGDVKLMAAVGAWLGPGAALMALLYTGIAGAALALTWTAMHRRSWEAVANMGALLRFHATHGLRPHPEINLKSATAIRIPYGLAIAAGTCGVLVRTLVAAR